jgi:peptidyl-prolyl cis-trans isomerase D
MITWMQRHKKYLIITIWISTIAFVGAGFVGWGQYSYGDKAGAVAKVGNIQITMGELQKSYSRLYAQYNQVFQGNFDEEKAKSFGLQSQALNQLTNQALILNLAASYDLRISDAELLADLMAQEAFLQNGKFNKDIYRETLSRNNLTTKEYEQDIKKQLLIQKVLKLLPVETSTSEARILNTHNNIADKIQYKVIDDTNISITTLDTELKLYWETKQQQFMNEVSYELKYIKQEKVTQEHSKEDINIYYTENKNHFKNDEAKVMSLEDSRSLVIDQLDAKATKEIALRNYIAYKKRKLSDDIEVKTAIISQTNNQFTQVVLDKVEELSITSPFLKPIEIDGEYFTFELVKINPSTVKTFEEAKEALIPMYTADKKREKLFELVKNSLDSFKGTQTDFITNADADKITELSVEEANEFLMQLFTSNTKKGSISLQNGKVVLYNILEQKMLENTNESVESIANLKSTIFSSGLIKILNTKYKTDIFIQGQ